VETPLNQRCCAPSAERGILPRKAFRWKRKIATLGSPLGFSRSTDANNEALCWKAGHHVAALPALFDQVWKSMVSVTIGSS